jgi:anti-sigma factor RsiW
MNEAHELLPWYVNGTLDPAQRRDFERHLKQCGSCASELPVVTELRRQVREHGWAEHAEHPEAEDLERAAAEGLDDPGLRRHLALCLTCAQEVRWLRGEEPAAAAAAPGAPVRPRSGWMAPAAAAALVVLAVASGLLIPWRQAAPEGGITRPVFVPAAEREAGQRYEVSIPQGALVQLHFEVDLGPADLPAAFEIFDASGRRVDRFQLREADLSRGIFLLTRPRAVYPDGDYVARLTPAGGGPAVGYPFRIVTPG